MGLSRALTGPSLPLKNRDTLPRQRRVVDVGGRGGSEDHSCKHQTYRPFARFGPLGTLMRTEYGLADLPFSATVAGNSNLSDEP